MPTDSKPKSNKIRAQVNQMMKLYSNFEYNPEHIADVNLILTIHLALIWLKILDYQKNK